MVVPVEEWEWFGFAGHLCADRCRFHMLTRVGDYLVSTVGAFWPNKNDDEMTQIDDGRNYETCLFKAGPMCDCGCGQPSIEGLEIDSRGSMNAVSSRDQHMEMCKIAAGLTSKVG